MNNSCIECEDSNCLNCTDDYSICYECRDLFELTENSTCACVNHSSLLDNDCVCDGTFGILNNTCIECEDSNCLNCSDDYSVCQECRDFFELTENSTCACANNSSPSGSDCVCDDNYGANISSCVECEVSDCLKCSDNYTVCTECRELFELSENNICVCVGNSTLIGSDCVCNSNYGVLNETCTECQDTNCFNCSDDYSTCYECRDLYELSENNTCGCGNNSHLDGVNCVCDGTFGANNSDCVECEDLNCLNCSDNYTICSECRELFELSESNSCLCVGNSTLIGSDCVCDSNYGVLNESCVECEDKNCLNCSDDYSKCYECRELYDLSKNGTCGCGNNSHLEGLDCICDDTFGINNSDCVECQDSGCFNCSDDYTLCSQCDPLSELSETDTCVCVSNSYSTDLGCVCNNTYGISNNNCIECEDNSCLDCSDNYTVCSECVTRYYLDSTCKKCKNTCKTCTNSSYCESCVENTILGSDTCECIENSHYSSDSDSCECDSGYSLNLTSDPKSCVNCFTYLTQDDIKEAKYSSDFKYFYIYFNHKIQKITKCSEVVNDTSVFGKGAECSLSSDTLIKVKLGSKWTPLTSTLKLNELKLLKKNSDYCASEPESTLFVNVNLDSLTYYSSGSLTGRTDIYLGCTSIDPVDYIARGLEDLTGLGLSVKWSASSENSTIEDYINSQLEDKEDSIINLDYMNSDFSGFSGNLTLIYTVTNKFNVNGSVNLTIFLSQKKLISIEIDGGNEFNVYSNQKLWFTVNVLDKCGQKKDIKYTWTYSEGPKEPKYSDKNGLIIDQYSLLPNSTYAFEVSASAGGVGSNVVELKINVKILDLILTLTAPASFSLLDDLFTIDASKSSNPNYKEVSSLTCTWSCEDGSKECNDELKQQFNNEKSTVLSFNSSYLKGYSYITVKVTIFSDSSSKSNTITVKISESVPTLTLTMPTGRLAISKDHFIPGTSKASRGSLIYTWELSGIESSDYLSKYLFLFIYANAFPGGGEYSVSLNAKSKETGESVDFSASLSVNYPPTCSSTSISPLSGFAFYDDFILYSDCIDEEEDYPLYSKVIYYNNDSKNQRKNVIKFGSTNKRFLTKLPSGNLTIQYSVCDTYDDCQLYDFSVEVTTKKNSRRLAEEDYESDYRDSISIDANTMPGLCIILTNSYDLSDSFWDEVLDDLSDYIESFSSFDTYVLNSASGCLSGLIGSEQLGLSIENYFSVYNLSLVALDKFKDYLNSSEELADFDDVSLKYYLDMAEIFISLSENENFNISEYEKSNFAVQFQVVAFQKQFFKKASGYEYEFDSDGLSTYRGVIDLSSQSSKTYKDVAIDVGSLNASSSQQIGLLISIFPDLGNFSLYSSGFEIRLSNDGNIVNEDFIFPTAFEYFTVFDPPILVQVPTKEQLSTSYRCGTLVENDQVNFTGCDIVNAGVDNVTLSISHTSLFIIVEPEILIGVEESCEVNYAPVSIMAVVGFIMVILIPIMILLDNNETLKEEENLFSDQGVSKTVEYSPHSPSSYTERPLNSMSDMSIPDPEEISESIIENPNAADYTIEFKLRSIDEPIKKDKKPKSCFSNMIEGHLLFGLYVYRPIFARVLRILVLGSTLILQLFLIGIFLFYRYETGDGEYDNTDEVSTQTLFDDYKDMYFGFCIVAVAIAIPYEVLLIFMFSQRWNKAALRTIGIIFLIVVTGGSIAGIIILSIDFCFKWSGYWAISFLWSILIEVFFLQFIYMLVRYPFRREKV